MNDPDWSLLPPDLLLAISEKVVSSLADYADHIRFRAVCHRWRTALSPHPLHLSHHLPWLMLPYPYCGNDHSICLFYDLSASKFHCLDLPQTRGFEICGSSHGWFILRKHHQLSLLNPITRAVISLPEFTRPPFHLGLPPLYMPDGELFFRNWDSGRYVMEPTTNLYVYKARLTSSPLNPDCLVFVHADNLWELSFCKIGDDHWTVIEFKCHAQLGVLHITDFTYSNDCLYTINGVGTVTMYILNTPSRLTLNCCVESPSSMYLVDGSSPEILLVAHVPESETEYIVYKLNNDEEPKWIEVSDIGQNVLFVDLWNAIILPSASLQLPGWGANCLCYDSAYMETQSQGQIFVPLFNYSIKIARLDNGKITAQTEDLGSFRNNEHCPRSLWLTPSLH